MVKILQHVLLLLWAILIFLFLHDLLLWNILVVHSIWILSSIIQLFLMYQTEAIVIIKFSDGKVNLQFIFHLFILLDFIKKPFCKRSDDTLFIITDDILEELIDELHFEVSKIKTSVVVAVVLICKIQYNLILLWFILWIQKLMNKSICEMLNLSMTGHQRIKFKLDLITFV